MTLQLQTKLGSMFYVYPIAVNYARSYSLPENLNEIKILKNIAMSSDICANRISSKTALWCFTTTTGRDREK